MPVLRQVGRYVVLEVASTDGTGDLLRAYDPKLRREVTIRLLFAAHDPEARARTVRDARALARLSHPNLVAVDEVDEHEGTPFIVMEHVLGPTMQAWLATRRPWRDALATMIAAGQGLLAAHNARIVHGDFNPSHVIIGTDGRVRVTDFGVAQSQRADIPSDLYAFCTTLWAAVYGKPPFVGSVDEVSAAQARHELPPVDNRGAPAWLHRELVRGLSPVVADRRQDMGALLGGLRHDVDRTRMRNIAGVVVATAATVGGIVGVRAWIEQTRLDGCDERGATIGTTWNDEARDALDDAIRRTEAVDAEAIAEKTTAWVDDFARRWHDARAQACKDGEVHRTISTEAYIGAVGCLDDRLLTLEAVLGELSRADAPAAYRSISDAASLPSPTTCRSSSSAAHAPPAALSRERLREVRIAISGASALGSGRDPTQGLALAHATLDEAIGLGWSPLIVSARIAVCEIQRDIGEYALAHAACEQAFFEASAVGLDDVAADAAIALVALAGADLDRLEEGRQWSLHAALALAKAGELGGRRAYQLLANRGQMMRRAGKLEEAKALHEAAVSTAEQSLGREHPELAVAMRNLAIDLAALGERDEAIAVYGRAVELAEHALGPTHPTAASIRADAESSR